GVSDDDVGALGEVEIRSAALHAPADHRQLHPLLDGGWRPAELLDERLARPELGGPANRLAALIDVENDGDVWIHHLNLDNGAGDGDDFLVVAIGVAMMRADGDRGSEQTRQQTAQPSRARRHTSPPDATIS